MYVFLYIHLKLLPILKHLTAKYCGFPVARTAVLGLIPDKFHKFVWSCWTFFCSFSFWVSANFTTIGELHPSIVWEWCIALIAVIAHCLVEKVTNAQPESWWINLNLDPAILDSHLGITYCSWIPLIVYITFADAICIS